MSPRKTAVPKLHSRQGFGNETELFHEEGTSHKDCRVNYKELVDDLCWKIVTYINDTSGWKVVKKAKYAAVSVKRSTDYEGNVYRVEATMDQPAEQVFDFLYLPEYRSQWDKSLQSYKLVEAIDQDTGIYHSITHSYGFGLVSPRDFVYIVHVKRYDGLLTTNSTSISHPRCPPSSSYVRGQAYPSSYSCYPLPGNPKQCMMVLIVQADLAGGLLPSVVESAVPTSLMNLVIDVKAGLKKMNK